MAKICNPNDLVLFKESKAFDERQKRFRVGCEKLRFRYENEFTQEEKIEWLNKYYENKKQTGWFDYVVNLEDKFNKAKKSMPLDRGCNEYVNTKSLIAWLKKNDDRHLVDDWYHYGSYTLFRVETSLDKTVGKDKTFRDHIDEAFHNLLVLKVYEEREIYRKTSSISQKVQKLQGYINTYGDLGLQICGDVGLNIRVDDLDHYDEKMFDEIIAEYEKLDNLAKTLRSNITAIGQKYNYKRF